MSPKNAGFMVAGWGLGLIIGTLLMLWISTYQDHQDEMRRLEKRCAAVGGSIIGPIGTADEMKPCVVDGKPVF